MTRSTHGRSAVAQPLTPSSSQSTGRSIRDWSARQRLNAVDALRYSRFVMIMKRALPIAAVALIASVVAYSVIPRHADRLSVATQHAASNINNDLTMTGSSLTGTDEHGNPFKVTAKEVVQDPKHQHRAVLMQVQADMQIDAKNWLSASAKKGVLDADAGTLKLVGGIALFTDSGYELHTESADIYIKTSVFEGNEKVAGHGPLGALSADRFHFDRLKKQVKLSGHVHMTMYPKKAKKR